MRIQIQEQAAKKTISRDLTILHDNPKKLRYIRAKHLVNPAWVSPIRCARHLQISWGRHNLVTFNSVHGDYITISSNSQENKEGREDEGYAY